MTDQPTDPARSPACPACGATLARDAPKGVCPRCFAGLAAGQTPDFSATGNSPASTNRFPLRGAAIRYFGDYELEGEIASGGMGIVYLARQRSLNRTVALKMLRTGALAGGIEVQRFRNEAEAAANLSHPNIVPIYEVGEHEGLHYFSMKLVEGGHLGELNAACPSRDAAWQRRAARLTATIARAVHHAHQHGVLHRDLKPTNILLDDAGEPHLTDFGLAKFLDDRADLTRTTAVLGTPHYMAPEQASGQAKHATTAADIYSLGAILYELLTGQPPFRGANALEVLEKTRTSEPPPIRSLNAGADRDLETICLKCLEKDPTNRYRTAEELALDLDRFLRDEPIEATPPSTIRRVQKFVRRNRVQVVAGGAVALIVLVLLGWLGVSARDRAVRRLAITRELTRTFEEIREQLEADQLPAASQTLKRAESVLVSSGSHPELEAKARRWRREIEMVEKLDEFRLEEFDAGYSAAEVEVSRTQTFTEVFFDYGLELATGDADRSAAMIRASPIRRQLFTAMDLGPYRPKLWPGVTPAQLREISEKADDDPWRNRFRQAATARDTAWLTGLDPQGELRNQPPAYATLVAQVLWNRGLRSNALDIAQAVHARHPDNFWANHTLAGFYHPATNSLERLSYTRAAVALRPQSVGLRLYLVAALFRNKAYAQAELAVNEALRLDPMRENTYVWAGNLAAIQRGPEAGLRMASNALERLPASAVTHMHYGRLLKGNRRLDEAVVVWRNQFSMASVRTNQEGTSENCFSELS